jgi:hypothetical protein
MGRKKTTREAGTERMGIGIGHAFGLLGGTALTAGESKENI